MLVRDLIGRLEEEKAKLAASLFSGTADTFERYQRLVGRGEGLQQSIDIINNLLTEDEASDERR